MATSLAEHGHAAFSRVALPSTRGGLSEPAAIALRIGVRRSTSDLRGSATRPENSKVRSERVHERHHGRLRAQPAHSHDSLPFNAAYASVLLATSTRARRTECGAESWLRTESATSSLRVRVPRSLVSSHVLREHDVDDRGENLAMLESASHAVPVVGLREDEVKAVACVLSATVSTEPGSQPTRCGPTCASSQTGAWRHLRLYGGPTDAPSTQARQRFLGALRAIPRTGAAQSMRCARRSRTSLRRQQQRRLGALRSGRSRDRTRGRASRS